jgi:hypothetical protein
MQTGPRWPSQTPCTSRCGTVCPRHSWRSRHSSPLPTTPQHRTASRSRPERRASWAGRRSSDMVCVCGGGGRTGCPKASTRSGGIERTGGGVTKKTVSETAGRQCSSLDKSSCTTQPHARRSYSACEAKARNPNTNTPSGVCGSLDSTTADGRGHKVDLRPYTHRKGRLSGALDAIHARQRPCLSAAPTRRTARGPLSGQDTEPAPHKAVGATRRCEVHSGASVTL